MCEEPNVSALPGKMLGLHCSAALMGYLHSSLFAQGCAGWGNGRSVAGGAEHAGGCRAAEWSLWDPF